MSRYGVNKFMRWVAQDPELVRHYHDRPEETLEPFTLSPAEKRALLDCDFATLYASGAHPQLLRRYTAAVWRGDLRELDANYSLIVSPNGRPDFAT